MKGKFRHYHKRNQVLKAIGFDSYADYLKSELWETIRKKVFQAKGRECFLCGGQATQVHHNRYDGKYLLGNKLNHIHPICAKCHHEIEFSVEGKKSLPCVRRKFRKRRTAYLQANKKRRKDNAIRRDSYVAIDIDSAAQRWGL